MRCSRPASGLQEPLLDWALEHGGALGWCSLGGDRSGCRGSLVERWTTPRLRRCWLSSHDVPVPWLMSP